MKMGFVLSVVLIIVMQPVSLGEQKKEPAESGRETKKNSDPCCCKDSKGYSGPPCHCLTQLWLDYPGADDLYICTSYYEDCQAGEGELWYGAPTDPHRPQSCDSRECEAAEMWKGEEDSPCRGHDSALTAQNAWPVVKTGLDAAKQKTPKLQFGQPVYYKIPHVNLPEGIEMTGDMLVIAVPITVKVTGSPHDGKKFSLCLQMDSADGLTTTSATFKDGKLGAGSQFTIDFSANGEEQKGLVWLK